MASNRYSDMDRGDEEMRFPPPDSPERGRTSPNADDSATSEVTFNVNPTRRRSRSREMVNIES